MKFYFINTLGDFSNDKLCMISRNVKGIGIKYYKLSKGIPIGDDYPNPAKIYLSDPNDEERFGGTQLASMLSNTKSELIVEKEVVEVIKKHCKNFKMEYLPFTLYDFEENLLSNNYFIVNVLEHFDCFNHKSGQITYKNKEVMKIHRYVLDTSKLVNAPPLFKIPEDDSCYIINEELANDIRKHNFTNFDLKEIQQK